MQRQLKLDRVKHMLWYPKRKILQASNNKNQILKSMIKLWNYLGILLIQMAKKIKDQLQRKKMQRNF